MSPVVAILTLLAAAAAAVAVVVVAGKVRQHRRLLDQRIDALAEQSYSRGEGADHRFDGLERRLGPLERRRRTDHLLVLAGLAERSGQLGKPAARRLERSLLELYDDVLLEDA